MTMWHVESLDGKSRPDTIDPDRDLGQTDRTPQNRVGQELKPGRKAKICAYGAGGEGEAEKEKSGRDMPVAR